MYLVVYLGQLLFEVHPDADGHAEQSGFVLTFAARRTEIVARMLSSPTLIAVLMNSFLSILLLSCEDIDL